jgi:hypothetical protein
MTCPLSRLPLNSVVQLPGSDIVAKLVKINAARAYVYVDAPDKLVTIAGRSFVAAGGYSTSWAVNTLVSLISLPQGETSNASDSSNVHRRQDDRDGMQRHGRADSRVLPREQLQLWG